MSNPWPPGWRKALPWGLLFGVIAAAIVVIIAGLSSGWNSLDRIF